jgi:hypothetical protein
MRTHRVTMGKGKWLALALLAGLAVAIPGVALGQTPVVVKTQAAGQAEAKSGEAKKPEGPKPGEDKTFEETVKDMEVRSGLFTFYRKADENKILMEIRPDQLDKTFIFAGTLEQATGERGLYAAQQGDDFPFYFRRLGKSIQWMEKNTNFVAEPGTPQARATAKSFPEAILGAAKIASKPKTEGGSVLVDAAELFVSDLPGFAPALNQIYQPSNYHFDKSNSSLDAVKAFPENNLLTLTLHYVTDNPRGRSVTLPDPRSVPFTVLYDLFAVQDTGYKPRLADDRVGHFTTVEQDFTSDHPSSPYLRYIHRWQLEKTDPSAKLSPPKQPIVFWLENTIPVEYRDAMREGVLLWNKAFERVGFQDAIVVKQQPDNPDWEAGDIRYSTIRWFAGVDATFAIGPSRANPYTGQTYNADIGMSEGLFRATRREGEELVEPSVAETDPPILASFWGRNQRFQCDYGNGLAQQAAFAVSLFGARGELTPAVEQQMMHEFIVEVTAHEVGHTLGLRHNFRASTLLNLSDLDNVAKTDQIGQTSSVMDYNPIVIAPKGQKQGHFLTPTLGPYDYWAIEYAYTPISGDQKAGLAAIASRVADPELPYSTDEDALGTLSPQAVDPLANQFDQSDDPLAFFKQRLGIVQELWAGEESKLAKPGEGYQILRRALTRGMSEYRYGLLVSSKFVGGIYTHRDHVGDPNGRLPYVTVPAAKQREALEMLRTFAFSEKAFQLPPGLLNKAAIERQPGLDFFAYFTQLRLDYPWHTAVLTTQSAVLNRLYHPITLARISDNELRFAPGEKPFTMADMFTGLDSAIWSELDRGAPSISSLRRNLQREQLKHLIRLVVRPEPPRPAGPPLPFAPPPTPPPPDDASTLARASLVRLQGKIKRALAGAAITDATTRAHLEETQALISSALQAHVEQAVD